MAFLTNVGLLVFLVALGTFQMEPVLALLALDVWQVWILGRITGTQSFPLKRVWLQFSRLIVVS